MERKHIYNEKPKNFQGPKAGPGPWPIRAHFVWWSLFQMVTIPDLWHESFTNPPKSLKEVPNTNSACIHMNNYKYKFCIYI